MENLKENVVVGSLATIAVAVAIGVFTLFGGSAPTPVVTQDTDSMIGGRVHNTQETFDAGIAVNGTEVISATRGISATTLAGTASLTVGNGTPLDKIVRTTVTVNPDSIARGGSTTTVVTVTGALPGDHCFVNSTSGDLKGATSTAVIDCRSGTGLATINYYNATGTSAFDAGPNNVLSVVSISF